MTDNAKWRAPFAKLVALQMSTINYDTPGRYHTNEYYRVIQRQERAIVARFKRESRSRRGDYILRQIDDYTDPFDAQGYDATRW